MAELLLKHPKLYSARGMSRFSVKEICAIVSNMSSVADKQESQQAQQAQSVVQSESQRLNGRLRGLLSKISDKDKPAFEQFYDSTIKLCFSQVLRITKKEDIAEEVISDVYMQVWKKAASYDEKRSGVMTWLMMLCRSRALDALRQRKNQQTKESVDINAIAEPFTDENPLDILNTIQQGSFLHSAISQLKPQQRQLLSLAYFKGLTHNEIANHTELAAQFDPYDKDIKGKRKWLVAKFENDAYKLRQGQKPESSIEKYTTAIRLNPDDAATYHGRVRAYIQQRNLNLALSDLKKAIDIDPDEINNYSLIDYVLAKSKDWDQIIRYWDKFIKFHPDNGRAYVERGGAYFHKGDIKSAVENAKISADLGNLEGIETYDKFKGMVQ